MKAIKEIKHNNNKNFFRDEEGFSTIMVVVSLLVTLSLIFSTAQVYRVTSASADIQNVADSAALAAENEVAEFMLLVRVCDATVLSFNISSLLLAGIGVVCLCIPPTIPAGEELIKTAYKVIEKRNSFSEKASSSLNKLQRSLPFLCAVKSYQTAAANNGGTLAADYLAISFLMPGEGATIDAGNANDIKNVVDGISGDMEELEKYSKEAEEAAKQAEEAKMEGWLNDCGYYAQSYQNCMYLRALSLSNISRSANPVFYSVDTWGFQNALSRAQAYYRARYSGAHPEVLTDEGIAQYCCALIFFDYCRNLLATGYVNDDGTNFSAYFPLPPRNLNEFRSTSMYSQKSFYVEQRGSEYCMHASKQCSGIQGSIIGKGSIEDLEHGNYVKCSSCHFEAETLGNFASATYNVPSGFEYYYLKVAQAAQKYQEAREKAAPASNKVKEISGKWFDKIKELIKEFAGKRIYAKPPGSYGVITMVVNKSTAPASAGFETSFVSHDSTIGCRAAFSGATMIEEESNDAASTVTSVLNKYKEEGSGGIGIGAVALNVWFGILKLYSNGQEGLLSSLEDGLNNFSFTSSSGLGTWAKNTLTSLLSTLGLEPAKVDTLKPVLINTSYIANAASKEEPTTAQGKAAKSFASSYISLKEKAMKYDSASNSLLNFMATPESIYQMLNLTDGNQFTGTIEIATISPVGDLGPSFPITITLPSFATDLMSNFVSQISSMIQNVAGSISEEKIWR